MKVAYLTNCIMVCDGGGSRKEEMLRDKRALHWQKVTFSMVIVPKSIFYDSELGDLPLDENKSESQKKDMLKNWGLDGLRFSSSDEEKDELSRYLKGAWAVDLASSQISNVTYRLTVNKTGDVPYKVVEVQDYIWTLGLPNEVLKLTPTITPKLSPLSELTVVNKIISYIDAVVEKTDNDFIECLWGWVKKPVTIFVEVTTEVVDFVVTLGVAIYDGDPVKALQALEDFGNFVWQGIVSCAKSAAEFYAQMNSFLLELALTALKVLIEKLTELVNMIVAALNWFINFILGLVEQAINTILKPAIDFIKSFLNELAEDIHNLIQAAKEAKDTLAPEIAKALLTIDTKGLVILFILTAIALAIEIILIIIMGTGIGAIIVPVVTTLIAAAVMAILTVIAPNIMESIVDHIINEAMGAGLALTSEVLACISLVIALNSRFGAPVASPGGKGATTAAGPASAIAVSIFSIILSLIELWITLAELHAIVPVICSMISLSFAITSVWIAFRPETRQSPAIGGLSKGFAIGSVALASGSLLRNIGNYLDEVI